MIKKVYIWSLVVIAMGCNTVKPTVEKENSILGTWVLEQRSGGFAGTTTDFDAIKKEHLLVLEKDKMVLWENGQKKSEQTYVIEKGKVIESSELREILKGDQSMPESITLKDGNLILKEQCYDCYTKVYRFVR